MSVASIFARSFAIVNVTTADVQAVIDALKILLKTTLSVVADRWTEPVANTLQTPVDPVSGEFMKLAFVRASATVLNITLTDKTGTTVVTGALVISGTKTINIAAGPTHLTMDVSGAADNDTECEFVIVDPSPEASGSTAPVVYGRASRAFGGGSAGLSGCSNWNCLDALAGYQQRLCGLGYSTNPGIPNGPALTTGGSEVIMPAYMIMFPTGAFANNRGTGAIPQMVLVDGSHPAGSQVVVPIDSGVLGTFQVLYAGRNEANNGPQRLAVRVL